jgi:hypothetical protein
MAKLHGLLNFTGKLDEISAYTRKDCEGIILRMGWGPSKEEIKTKDNYVNTRRNNAEFGGRSTTGKYIKQLLDPLKTVFDYNISPVLNGLLKPVQDEDRESPWGHRNVLISRKPYLLEGLTLNRRNPLESVISTPIKFEVDKEAGTALINVPELMPSVNFFPPENFSVCRITTLLGLMPDFYFAEPLYKPLQDVSQWLPVVASTDWFVARNGCPASEISLSLTGTLPAEGYSLMLAVGVQVGRPSPGYVTPLKHNGCAKIAVVR